MRAVGYEELAVDAQCVTDGGHRFVLQYRLVRERLDDGTETHFVRCHQSELRDGQALPGKVEVAGLGSDAAAARSIYDLLVGGGAMPVHLQDIVREQRGEWAGDGEGAPRRRGRESGMEGATS